MACHLRFNYELWEMSNSNFNRKQRQRRRIINKIAKLKDTDRKFVKAFDDNINIITNNGDNRTYLNSKDSSIIRGYTFSPEPTNKMRS